MGWMKKNLVVALLVLFAAGACAQTGVGGVGAQAFLQAWFPVVWIVILIAMLATSLAFMVGKGFGMRELEVWGKEELYQAIASAVILGVFSGIIFAMDASAKAFAADILEAGYSMPEQFAERLAAGEAVPRIALHWQYRGDGRIRWEQTAQRLAAGSCVRNDPAAACHFYIARAFLGSTFEKLYKVSDQAVRAYAWLVLLDTLSVNVGFVAGLKFAISIGVSPFGGTSIIYDTIETAFTVMVKSLVLLKFQEIALMYIERGVFPIFMISGLMLRSVWFTRKLGGLLLAMAIGFYTILPFMYILDWYTMDASLANYNLDALGMLGTGTTPESYFETEQPGQAVQNEEDLLFTEYEKDNSVLTYGMLDLAARYALIAFGAPVINLLVWLGFTRALSGFLGGDIEIAGITRII